MFWLHWAMIMTRGAELGNYTRVQWWKAKGWFDLQVVLQCAYKNKTNVEFLEWRNRKFSTQRSVCLAKKTILFFVFIDDKLRNQAKPWYLFLPSLSTCTNRYLMENWTINKTKIAVLRYTCKEKSMYIQHDFTMFVSCSD